MGVTLTVRSRSFPSGQDLIASSMLTLQQGSSLTLTAPGTIVVPDPGNPGTNLTYAFLFWNVTGALHSTTTVNVANVGSTDFTASSWYLLTGGGSGPPTVGTSAFSITQDLVLATTPIQAVVPSSAWAGGNATSVSTGAAAVTITAKGAISGENLQQWVVFGAGVAGGADLSVPKGGSAIALASYKLPSGGGFKPGFDFEMIEVLEGIRGRVKDWVFDPAPIDLLRLSGKFSQVKAPAEGSLPVDDLSALTANFAEMDEDALRSAHAELKTRLHRLEAAEKMIDKALDGYGKKKK